MASSQGDVGTPPTWSRPVARCLGSGGFAAVWEVEGGATVAEKGREIFELMLRTASGEKSKSEAQGFGADEFVPWQIGAVM